MASRRSRGNQAIYTVAAKPGSTMLRCVNGWQPNSALRRPGAPAKYHENSACSPRWLTAQNFSIPWGLARLLPRMRESARRFRLSSSTCALLREASRWHHQGRSSSTGSIQAEKLLLLGSWLPPVRRSWTAILSPNFLWEQRPNHILRLFLCLMILVAMRQWHSSYRFWRRTCYSIHSGATPNVANRVGRCPIAERSLRRCPQLLRAYHH